MTQREHAHPVRRTIRSAPAILLVAAIATGTMGHAADAPLKGSVKVDGSSTVAPIMMAAAELFGAQQPRVRVPVGISGTGGGFKKFLAEEPDLRTDISDASRPIMPSELERAKKLGIEFIEIPVAIDGIAVMVHPSNSLCDYLTVDELKRIWEPGSTIQNWNQIRKEFPDLPLKLYGPGTDSGTFDYFTEVIVGEAKASRSDFTASESDNALVHGIAGDRGALGYFGYSYYESNKDKLKIVAIDNGDGKPVAASLESIRRGDYKPLSRPMFLYVNSESYKRPEVKAFLEFLLKDPAAIVEHPRVNYVALPDKVYEIARARLEEGVTGSAMAEAAPGVYDLAQIFATD
jgi:phosphate transport system substrate-binding protein